MLDKELLMAVLAYNLVWAAMAARRSRIDPRQISFTHVLTVVDYVSPKLIAALSKKHPDKEFFESSIWPLNALFPKRKKHRSYLRLQWRRGGGSLNFRKAEN